jgi:hypothetical protein
MADFVPATTPIKYQRVSNVDTDRLARREAELRSLLTMPRITHEIDGRMELRMRVRELLSITAELERRADAELDTRAFLGCH